MLPLKMVRSLVLGDTTTTTQQQPSHFPTHRNPSSNNADADEENPPSLSGNENDGDDNGNSHHHHRHHRRRRSTRTRRRGGGSTTSRRKIKTPTTIVEAGNKTPFLLFTPTRELIQDTYRLAAIARDIGMDLYPNSSLSHIIFSWPSSIQPTTHNNNNRSPHGNNFASTSSSSAASTSTPSSSSYRSSTSSPPLPLCSLPDEAVPLPFPTLTLASISLLRYFVSLSKGMFKLVFVEGGDDFFRPVKEEEEKTDDRFSSWDCSSLSLMSRATGCRVETMDMFSRVLAGHGWTMFKTAASKKKVGLSGEESSEYYGTKSAYLFRRVDPERIRARDGNGVGRNCSRVRELRLPPLDFNNVPLRILQYIVLMTEDVFILA